MKDRNPQVELIIAARLDDIDGASLALKQGARMNEALPNPDNGNRGNNLLITVDDRTSTALHIAIRYGHIGMVKFLLHKENDVNQICNGKTPLSLAAEMGNLDIATVLLEHGADPNLRDNLGRSPYQIAAASGNVDLINLLLAKNCSTVVSAAYITDAAQNLYRHVNSNPNAIIELVNILWSDSTPHQQELFTLLNTHGRLRLMLLNANKESGLALFRLLDYLETDISLDCSKLLPEKYTFTNYYLKEHLFEEIKKLPLEERLKKYQAILLEPESVYHRLFHMKRGYFRGVDITRGLLKEIREAYDRDRNESERLQREHDDNLRKLNEALAEASKAGDLVRMRECLDQGADVDAVTNTFLQYPILHAAYYGHLDAVKLLVKYGAHINEMTLNNGYNKVDNVTALYSASEQGHHEIVSYLLENGAQTEIARKFDCATPLITAVANRNLNTVKVLLQHFAKIDTFGNEYNAFKTPLSLATREKSEQILALLVDHMIDHYNVERIMNFLATHDNLKTCYQRAGNQAALLAPLNKLVMHLLEHNVSTESLQNMLPDGHKLPEKQPAVEQPVVTASMYPKLVPAATITPSDELQQYMARAKVIAETKATAVENPFTGEPLPATPACAASADPFAAIDELLAAPTTPSWLARLAEIDFSDQSSSTSAIMQQLGDLISFDQSVAEPTPSMTTPFDNWEPTPAPTTSVTPSYINPFDGVDKAKREAIIKAEIDKWPKAPTGFGVFAASSGKAATIAPSQSGIAISIN